MGVEVCNRWLIETDAHGTIISATECGIEVRVGSVVISTTGNLGPKLFSVGRVIIIENPEVRRTTDLYGIDFENSGLPTAHLKITEFKAVGVNNG